MRIQEFSDAVGCLPGSCFTVLRNSILLYGQVLSQQGLCVCCIASTNDYLLPVCRRQRGADHHRHDAQVLFHTFTFCVRLLTTWFLLLLWAAGANVVLTTKGIDDMTLKYFVEAGVMAVRRVPKDDLK
jgi:hypothetical protein